MKVTVVHPEELGQSELAKWRSIQRSTRSFSNPFLSPDFTVAVGRVRPRARVAVLFDGSEIVGFFPFERRELGYGVPIAAWHTDCQGLVHLAELDWDPQQLLKACGLSVWEFNHLVDEQKPFEPYQTARHPSPIMDLSGGFDAFYGQLLQKSARFTRDLPRRQRMLVRDLGETRFVFDSRDLTGLQTVMTWKSAQYVRMGWGDRFTRPWLVQLLEQLLDTRTEGFSGILSMFYAGEKPIAGHFQLRFDHVLAGWYPAYDPRFRKYSPGITHHLLTAKEAAASGITQIELGRGAADYKNVFGNRDLFVSEGRVVRRSPGAALHWVRRTSIERLHQVVKENPSLYKVARRAYTGYGRIGAAMRRRASSVPTLRLRSRASAVAVRSGVRR